MYCTSVWLDIHIRARARAYRATVEKGQDHPDSISKMACSNRPYTKIAPFRRFYFWGVIVSEAMAFLELETQPETEVPPRRDPLILGDQLLSVPCRGWARACALAAIAASVTPTVSARDKHELGLRPCMLVLMHKPSGMFLMIW